MWSSKFSWADWNSLRLGWHENAPLCMTALASMQRITWIVFNVPVPKELNWIVSKLLVLTTVCIIIIKTSKEWKWMKKKLIMILKGLSNNKFVLYDINLLDIAISVSMQIIPNEDYAMCLLLTILSLFSAIKLIISDFFIRLHWKATYSLAKKWS